MKSLLGLAILPMFALSQPAQGTQVTVDKDRMLLVNGERTFVIGLYENPKSDADLKRVAEAGFNLVHATDSVESLDRLGQHGLFAWVNTSNRIDLSADEENRRNSLRSMAEELGSHPALIVWEVPDEALWNTWWGPSGWRMDEEPKALAERVGKLESGEIKSRLIAALDKASRHRSRGEYRAAEDVADSIWADLGEKSPKPDVRVSDWLERADRLQKGMLAGYRYLKKVDPEHPVWMNHAPRNEMEQLTAFGKATDIAGCDIYPAPDRHNVRHSDLVDQTLSSVGAYTRRMQASIPGKPVWMVLQGFGWGDIQPALSEEERKELRRPGFSETRFMAYDTIVHGARGILYWGTAYVEKDSEFWNMLLDIVEEMSGLQPLLSAPDADVAITVKRHPGSGSGAQGVMVLPKQVGEHTCLLVVNESTGPVYCTLGNLPAAAGSWKDLLSGETFAAESEAGRMSLGMAPHAVYVLAPANAEL